MKLNHLNLHYPNVSRVLGYGKPDLPDSVIKAFTQVARDQREAPENRMLDVARFHSGLLAFCVEHAGDLTHRMTEMTEYGMNGRGYVQDKASSVLHTLNHHYGFEREHAENIQNNAPYEKLSIEEYKVKLNQLLKKYADAHRALVVYNDLQHVARECAVSLGEQKFDRARVYLSSLLRIANNKEEYEKAWAEYTLDANGNPVPYKPY